MVANREHPPFSKYLDPPQNAYIFFTQFFCFPFYWTPSARRLLQKKRVCPSVLLTFHSSFRLSVSFLGIGSLVFFLKTWCQGSQGFMYGMVLSVHIQLRVAAGFFGKNPHLGKMVKNGPKTWFLDFLRKPCHQFCLKFV